MFDDVGGMAQDSPVLIQSADQGLGRVFISYARRDLQFAENLVAALVGRGFEAFLDTKQILPGEAWRERLSDLISKCDTLVFLITPDSVEPTSVCDWELNEAERLGKRLLPVVVRRVPDQAVPSRLRRLNWLFMMDADGFASGLDNLCRALLTDIDWIREHTRLADLARKWADQENQGEHALLRGKAIEEAELWISSRPDTQETPNVTEEQRRFIRESRYAEQARSERERRQIERSRYFQKLFGRALAGVAALVVAMLLNVLWQQRQTSLRESRVFTQLSKLAADNANFELAARYALAALPPRDLLPNPLYPKSDDPGPLLVNSEHRARLETILSAHTSRVAHASFNRAGDAFVTLSTDGTVRVWDAFTHRDRLVLHGHSKLVTDVTFSPDGTRLATASFDRTARVWDLTLGKTLFVADSSPCSEETYYWGCGMSRVAFSEDGRYLATGSFSGEVLIWEVVTGNRVAVLPGHRDRINVLQFDASYRLLTASDDGTAQIWDAPKGIVLMVLKGEGGFVRAGALSPDGAKVATGYSSGVVRIWDSTSGASLFTLQRHENYIVSMSFSSDGKRLMTASWDGTARIWDVGAGTELTLLRGHGDLLTDAKFSPHDEFIVTASRDNSMRLWNGKTGTLVSVLVGHVDTVESVGFSPDESRLISSSRDSTVRLWKTKTRAELKTLHGHTASVGNAVFSTDSRLIVTASSDTTARLWDADSGRQIAILAGHKGAITSVAFSADSKRVLTSSTDGVAILWDASDGRRIATVADHSQVIYRSRFSADGKYFATASFDHTARVWRTEDGKMVSVLSGHTDWLRDVVFTPDGTRLVTVSRDKTARLWETATGRVIAVLRGHTNELWTASFDPDGRRLVTASLDGTARIWDSFNGNNIAVLSKHTGRVWSAIFSRNGQFILTGSGDGTARIWSKDGAELRSLIGHRDQLMNAVFSPDDKLILTASHDRTARLWDAMSGTEMVVLSGHNNGLTGAAFDATGKRVVTSSTDGTARTWQILDLLDADDATRRDAVCQSLLQRASQHFAAHEMKDPILFGRSDLINPCERFGALHPKFYAQVAQDYWQAAVSFVENLPVGSWGANGR